MSTLTFHCIDPFQGTTVSVSLPPLAERDTPRVLRNLPLGPMVTSVMAVKIHSNYPFLVRSYHQAKYLKSLWGIHLS